MADDSGANQRVETVPIYFGGTPCSDNATFISTLERLTSECVIRPQSEEQQNVRDDRLSASASNEDTHWML